jgi:hypothetical protein
MAPSRKEQHLHVASASPSHKTRLLFSMRSPRPYAVTMSSCRTSPGLCPSSACVTVHSPHYRTE